jgi:hypothetical protein
VIKDPHRHARRVCSITGVSHKPRREGCANRGELELDRPDSSLPRSHPSWDNRCKRMRRARSYQKPSLPVTVPDAEWGAIPVDSRISIVCRIGTGSTTR